MVFNSNRNQQVLEYSLIIVIIGLTALMQRVVGYKMVVLNLFFLPVILGAFFLGRYRAGVLALLSVILVTSVAAQDFSQLASFRSPLVNALALTIWAGALGLTTILAGTLSDERYQQMHELHSAYIGVIEVLSKYFQSKQPGLKDRPLRIADLGQRIGLQLRMNSRDIDDVRVALLLQEMDHIQITTRVIRRPMGNFDSGHGKTEEHTFHASDLVQSLGSVLNGTLPLLCRFDETTSDRESASSKPGGATPVLGASVVRIAQVYDRIVHGQNPARSSDPLVAMNEIKSGMHGNHPPEVLHALEQVVLEQTRDEAKGRSGSTTPTGTQLSPTLTAT